MNSEKQRRQFEVNEEDHNSKIDQRVWRGNQVRLFVEYEDDWSNDWSFGVAEIKFKLFSVKEILSERLQAGLHEFHRSWSPSSANQSLDEFGETSAVSFQCSDDDHDDVSVWIKLGRMDNSIVNLKKISIRKILRNFKIFTFFAL